MWDVGLAREIQISSITSLPVCWVKISSVWHRMFIFSVIGASIYLQFQISAIENVPTRILGKCHDK